MRVARWSRRTVSPADWQASNVPEGKWGVGLDAIPQGLPFVGRVRAYVEGLRANIEAGMGLILWGPYRGGKSCVAAAAVGEAMAHGLEPYWIDAFDVADASISRSCWRRDNMRGAPLLVLDDLGMESQDERRGEFPREKIRALLKYRLERLRPVVITTNMSLAEVRKVYGDKTWALLQEYTDDVLVKGAEDHWRRK